MSMTSIIDRLNAILSEEFEVDSMLFTPDASLSETLDLDSLDYVDLIVLIESQFGIKVEQEKIREVRTFSDLYAYVESYISESIN